MTQQKAARAIGCWPVELAVPLLAAAAARLWPLFAGL